MESNHPLKSSVLTVFKKLTADVLFNYTVESRKCSKLPSVSIIEYDSSKVKNLLNLKSPFIFLTSKEKDALLSKATYVEYIGNQQEVFLKENDGKDYCLLILEGEFIAVDTRSQASEILGVGDSFGFDACLFGMTYYKVVTASSECIVMKIHSDIMISILEPDKQFTVMVGSN